MLVTVDYLVVLVIHQMTNEKMMSSIFIAAVLFCSVLISFGFLPVDSHRGHCEFLGGIAL